MSLNPNRRLRPAPKLRLAHIRTKRSHTVLQMKRSHTLLHNQGATYSHTHDYKRKHAHKNTSTFFFFFSHHCPRMKESRWDPLVPRLSERDVMRILFGWGRSLRYTYSWMLKSSWGRSNLKRKNFSASNPSQGIKKQKSARHFNLSSAYPHMKCIYF